MLLFLSCLLLFCFCLFYLLYLFASALLLLFFYRLCFFFPVLFEEIIDCWFQRFHLYLVRQSCAGQVDEAMRVARASV